MDTGLLWFDDTPGALSERVRRAVEYYAQKFGRSPTLCLVNPAMLDKDDRAVAGIQLRGARTVMVNHFYLGEDKSAERKANGGSGRSNGHRSGESTRRKRAAKSGNGAPGSARRRRKAAAR
jgi:hypothetical protein